MKFTDSISCPIPTIHNPTSAEPITPSFTRPQTPAHSYFSIVARIALSERTIPYTPVLVDILNPTNPAQFDPAYLALTPQGTVPVLVGDHDGETVTLTDSRDILRWCFPTSTIPPAVAAASARVEDRWYGGDWDYVGAVALAAPEGPRKATVDKWVQRGAVARKRMEEVRERIDKGEQGLQDLWERYKEKAELNASRVALYSPTLPPTPTATFPYGPHKAHALCAQFEQCLSETRDKMRVDGDAVEYWFVGEVFSPADILIAALLTRFKVFGYEGVLFGQGTSQYPLLTDYWSRLTQRRSYVEAVTDFKMDK
ncbi:hypothetical protein HDU93_008969 [Gonapodya sp. JEL0774]|nr:hypothetical protein HDU93_008969 [Gonapodya sp. JEL0774]